MFPVDSILTPPELASRYADRWPSMQQLMADGKRLMVVSLTDYGEEMAGLVFARGLPVCRWLEPELVRRFPAFPCISITLTLLDPMHTLRLTCKWRRRVQCCTPRAGAWSPCTLGDCSAP